MQKSRLSRWFLVLAMGMILMASCSSYYMVKNVPTERQDYVFWLLEDTSRYVIVHFKNADLHYYQISVDRQKGIFKGKTEKISRNHQVWRTQKTDSINKYSKSEYSPLGEAHLTVDINHSVLDTFTEISIDQVTQVKHYAEKKPDAGEKGSRVAIVLIVVLGITLFLVFSIQNISYM